MTFAEVLDKVRAVYVVEAAPGSFSICPVKIENTAEPEKEWLSVVFIDGKHQYISDPSTSEEVASEDGRSWARTFFEGVNAAYNANS